MTRSSAAPPDPPRGHPAPAPVSSRQPQQALHADVDVTGLTGDDPADHRREHLAAAELGH